LKTKERNMTIVSELHEVVTAHGNALRGNIEVGGKEFRIETDEEKTHIQIIDNDSCCETGEIDEDGDVIAKGGECVTQNWTSDDWTELTKFVGARSLGKSVNEIDPAMVVMVECGENTLELTAQTLIDNGFGSLSLDNPQNAGPVLNVGEAEFETLKAI
jgi:hypothetical protein